MFVVIFESLKNPTNLEEYSEIADHMEQLAKEQPGYIRHLSVRGENEIGITLSYWESKEAIVKWKKQADHLIAQKLGMEKFYKNYKITVAEVISQKQWPPQKPYPTGP